MKKAMLQCSLQVLCSSSLLFLPGCKGKAVMKNDEPTSINSDSNDISVLLNVAVVEGKRAIVVATFCNKSNVTVGIEKRRILYSNRMNWNAFRVTRDKKNIPYIGVYQYILDEFEKKRDIYNLMPGASYTARIKLHNEYDLSRPGTYTVTYEGMWRLPDEKGNEDLFWICSNTVEFKLKKGIPPAINRAN
jgi:hypothetical protein